MIDLTKYQKTEYLKAEDLGANGLTVAINEVEEKYFEREKKWKVVLHFANHDQKMVLNKTRLRALIGFFGDNTNQWIGKTIWLTIGDTPMGASVVVNARSQGPGQPQQPGPGAYQVNGHQGYTQQVNGHPHQQPPATQATARQQPEPPPWAMQQPPLEQEEIPF